MGVKSVFGVRTSRGLVRVKTRREMFNSSSVMGDY